MEFTQDEVDEGQMMRVAVERFMHEYTGPASGIKAAWDAYRFKGDSRPVSRNLGLDKLRSPSLPSADELTKRLESILKIHNRLQGFMEPAQVTVPNKFKYKAEGDASGHDRLPAIWCDNTGWVASVDPVDPGEFERALSDAATRELEARVEALRAKRKKSLVERIEEARKPGKDKHFTCI